MVYGKYYAVGKKSTKQRPLKGFTALIFAMLKFP